MSFVDVSIAIPDCRNEHLVWQPVGLDERDGLWSYCCEKMLGGGHDEFAVGLLLEVSTFVTMGRILGKQVQTVKNAEVGQVLFQVHAFKVSTCHFFMEVPEC